MPELQAIIGMFDAKSKIAQWPWKMALPTVFSKNANTSTCEFIIQIVVSKTHVFISRDYHSCLYHFLSTHLLQVSI